MNFLKISDLAYNELKKLLEEKNIETSMLRIYLASMSCHGPAFNIAVDTVKEGDLTQKVQNTIFIVDKTLFMQYSGFILLCGEENGLGGITLEPVYTPESTGCGGGCSSCSCDGCE